MTQSQLIISDFSVILQLLCQYLIFTFVLIIFLPLNIVLFIFSYIRRIYFMSRFRQNLFRLTQPHPCQRFSYTASSFLHDASMLDKSSEMLERESTKKTQLKFKYLHRLDVDAIDKKYKLLQRLKRITKVDDNLTQGDDAVRQKQYSIETYYIFNENQQIDRRYKFNHNKFTRNKSNDHIHFSAIPPEELLKHQLKEHRQFLQRFKPKKQTGPILVKRFRFNRKSTDRLKRFQ